MWCTHIEQYQTLIKWQKNKVIQEHNGHQTFDDPKSQSRHMFNDSQSRLKKLRSFHCLQAIPPSDFSRQEPLFSSLLLLSLPCFSTKIHI